MRSVDDSTNVFVGHSLQGLRAFEMRNGLRSKDIDLTSQHWDRWARGKINSSTRKGWGKAVFYNTDRIHGDGGSHRWLHARII